MTDNLNSGHFSIVTFYEKRARRILPALFFVLLITSLFAYISLSPADLKNYSQSLVAVVAFSSNVYFYLTSGYFSNAAEELPLLHTWSLAVEEQYYVFYPILLAALWKYKSYLLSILITLSVVSFFCSLFLTEKDYSASFYLLFSRAWELFAGGFLALLQSKFNETEQRKRELLSITGGVLVLWSLFFVSRDFLHPGWITLVPVTGTVLLIGFGENTRVGKILSWPLLVFVGLISYSLYLWHQPIYAFIRVKSVDEPTAIVMLFATLLAFAMACFSYYVIERYFRKSDLVSKSRIFQYSITGLILFFMLGITGHFYNGLESRFNNQELLSSIEHSPYRYQCHSSNDNILSYDDDCKLSGRNSPDWAVLGDSHGVELSYALARTLGDDNRVHQLTFSGCLPAFTFETTVKGCKQWLTTAIKHIQDSGKIQNVILAFRHINYVTPTTHKYSYTASELSQYSPTKIKVPRPEFDPKAVYWESVGNIVDTLLASGKNVFLMSPVPEPRAHINKLIVPLSIFQDFGSSDTVSVDNAAYELHINEINKYLLKQADKVGVFLLDTSKALCDEADCYATNNGQSMFFDDNHLSVAGALNVVTLLKEDGFIK